ncbi:MAG TPA: aromatic ring-hydroxylating dioxygenase subunit alpha [Egicoccus sp.]|nr:aromatic ring-hydroxylating dioxygenase subunit alpha [Egicoccus sp.]HSK21555.1 aromatic ring-hydroxylating dioxygenase subunit alpha [Egicoccus sp.]
MTQLGTAGTAVDADRILQRARELLPGGELPAAMFNNRAIFELERERIFARSWVYLAHESEIPEPGDYVLRYVVDDPFIVVRDADGQLRAMHNQCRHRGMQVCRSEAGNASNFRCPYHGWTYRNTGQLTGVPVEKQAYGDALDKDALGLLQIPQLDTYNGMIFGCLDPHQVPLAEWLGELTWYLDFFTRRSPAGLEVIGAPQRWVVDVDWKVAAENFIGDSYHTLMTHRSMVELGQAPSDPKYAMYGEQVHIPGSGHGAMLIGAPPGTNLPPFWGYPQDAIERARTSLSDEQFDVAYETRIMLSTVFPNLSIHNPIRRPDHRYEGSIPMMTWRVWNPRGPGQIEIFSWFLVEKDMSEEFKHLSRLSYLRSFGISGTFEQDDAEIWTHIARNAGTFSGSRHRVNYQMGKQLETDPNWPGPGVAQPANFTDANLRNFYARWLQLMTDGEGDAA